MTCVSCRQASRAWLCGACRSQLAVPPERLVGGLLVRSAFVHEGPARMLVHRLKYEGVAGIASHLAPLMDRLLPRSADVLVPVTRVTVRRIRYGVDPAVALARALSRFSGRPVVEALRPEPWVRRRAGGSDARRGRPTFRSRRTVSPESVLVDDVLTTGTTLRAAARVTGSRWAVTLTAATGPIHGARYSADS